MRSTLMSLLLCVGSLPAFAAAPMVFELHENFAMAGAVKINAKWEMEATKFPNDQVARIKKGVTARVFDLDGEQGVVQIKGWREEAPCDWNRYSDTNREFQTDQYIYAIDAPWKLMPRAHKTLRNNDPTYFKIVQAQLDALKLKQAPLMSQLLQVDLDGDGKNEVIVVAQTSKPGQIEVGDYSLLFVRKLVNEKVQTFMLDQYVISKAHNEETGEGAMQGEMRQITAIADVDGDGSMEILVGGQSHEAGWTDIYTWRGGKFAKLMSWGCGV